MEIIREAYVCLVETGEFSGGSVPIRSKRTANQHP